MGSARYEPIEVVGSGAMATVWRARDTQLGRVVAIKRPHPAPHDSAVHDRFRREAKAAATVSHENLVTVFDAGSDETGPFLVMEFVDAPSLAEIEWSPSLALSVGAGIADALDALHGAGIVHRDVKPANILATDSGALLTDFGIARAVNDETLTLEGSTFATPAYAAPEVTAHGNHSTASDVYSLGVVLREMITGQRTQPATDTQVRVTDPSWGPILEAATSTDPASRPDAREFARRLRALPASAALAETRHIGVGVGSAGSQTGGAPTKRIDTADTVRRPVLEGDPGAQPRRRRRLGMAAIVATCAVALGGWWIASSTDGDGIASEVEQTTGGESSVASVLAATATETAPEAETETESPPPEPPEPTSIEEPAPADTAPTESVDDAGASEPSELSRAHDELVAVIGQIPDDQVKPKAAERLIADVDKAIEAAGEGDIDKAESEFDKSLDRVDKEFDDVSTGDDIMDAIETIARLSGVDT